MQRRTALKNVATTLAGLAALPAWANGWNQQQLSKTHFLTPAEDTLLAEVVETIIPATDTPGAKELGVHRFVQKMLDDCYDQKAQESFKAGLAALDGFSQQIFKKPFAEGTAPQRIYILEGTELSDDPAKKAFFGMVKNLTIQGYMNSEYVMTNLTHYEMIPGRFHGCVPVEKA
ncbi:gluconate 2-dehydrogenase subunit 3 family protein [Salmonirosea aquatica]|uniref:Gluconate 2-dehydrogenase subunit 3 family protein n=1 Tax=Salmonirosea aquatica TaxID=2654236 RepID=A0A7C9BKU5_9BACT|nr:gluconate 2-dehydrogenase subunit 3 family protein [Cytophagaceae bacterium SJW1-29]